VVIVVSVLSFVVASVLRSISTESTGIVVISPISIVITTIPATASVVVTNWSRYIVALRLSLRWHDVFVDAHPRSMRNEPVLLTWSTIGVLPYLLCRHVGHMSIFWYGAVGTGVIYVESMRVAIIIVLVTFDGFALIVVSPVSSSSPTAATVATPSIIVVVMIVV